MGLRDIGATLPPGFRFYPSDEELVCHYLYKKVAHGEVSKDTLVEIDLHTCEPWQLPEVAKLNVNEWYFFSFRDRKYATGYRTNRATTTGYWKATGKDRTVVDPKTRSMVGMRKTLVFYKNRAPNGIKTGWIMHEFRLENPNIPPKEDWVLCRVFHKSKTENGDQNDVCDNINTITRSGAATSPAIGESAQMDDRHTMIMSRGNYNGQISCYTPAAVHHQSHQYSSMLAQLDRNYLQLSHDIIHGGGGDGRILYYKSEAEEEECGAAAFFFDGINAGAAPISNTLEEMQFDDDSSLVFI